MFYAHKHGLVKAGKQGSRILHRGFGWKNQTSKCMHWFMLSNSSTELTHDSATNINTRYWSVVS